MRVFLRFVVGCCVACSSAEAATSDAQAVAESFMESGWSSVENAMPVMMAGLQANLKQQGASDGAAQVLVEEIRQQVTKEAFTAVMAEEISRSFSESELRELHSFLVSPLGKKYLEFGAKWSVDGQRFLPLVKRACNASKARLKPFDWGTLNRFCSGSD